MTAAAATAGGDLPVVEVKVSAGSEGPPAPDLPVLPAPPLQIGSSRGYVRGELPPGLGAAYRAGEGSVLICWPGQARSTYTCGLDAYWGGGPHELLALLTREDCDEVAALWEAGAASEAEHSAARLRAVQHVAADRARARGHLLRQLRRGQQPPGSVTTIGSGVLVRFPDGRGWWACPGRPCPWGWKVDRSYGPISRVLGLGLDEATCFAAAQADGEGPAARAMQVAALVAEAARRRAP